MATASEPIDWPEGLSSTSTDHRLSEVYDLVRSYLDGDSDDLRAYEALDFLYGQARNALGLPAWYLPRTDAEGGHNDDPDG